MYIAGTLSAFLGFESVLSPFESVPSRLHSETDRFPSHYIVIRGMKLANYPILLTITFTKGNLK
eukprot:UN25705